MKTIIRLLCALFIATLLAVGQPHAQAQAVNSSKEFIEYNEMKTLLAGLSSKDECVAIESYGELNSSKRIPGASTVKLLPEMRKLLATTDDYKTQATILRVLYMFGKEAKPALPEVKKYLNGKDEYLKGMAKTIVANVDNGTAMQKLPPTPAGSTDKRYLIEYPKMKQLLEQLSSKDKNVAWNSLYKIVFSRKIPAKSSLKLIPEMRQTLATSNDYNTQRAVLSILDKFGKEAKPALPEVEKYVKSDNDMLSFSARTIVKNVQNNKPMLTKTPRRSANDARKLGKAEMRIPIKPAELQKYLKDYQAECVDYSDDYLEKYEAKIMAGRNMYCRELDPSAYDMIPEIAKIIDNLNDTSDTLPLIVIIIRSGDAAKVALPTLKRCLNSHDRLVRAAAQEGIDSLNQPKK